MEDKIIINSIVKWWESKRLIFNLAVGLTGVFGMIRFATYFDIHELILLIIYGIVANLFYSSGILIEIFDSYYFNNKLKLERFRLPILILGILFSCLITYIGTLIHYMPFL